MKNSKMPFTRAQAQNTTSEAAQNYQKMPDGPEKDNFIMFLLNKSYEAHVTGDIARASSILDACVAVGEMQIRDRYGHPEPLTLPVEVPNWPDKPIVPEWSEQ